MMNDDLCHPAITLDARQLVGLVCRKGGADCPLIEATRAEQVLGALARDPTVAVRLVSTADGIPHYSTLGPEERKELAATAFQRKRDLDVLQRLGLCPGDTRRARWLFELLFARIATLDGLCACDTEGWEGCPVARQGVYESVRDRGWRAMVYCRSEEERASYRRRSAQAIATGDTLYVRPHHFMCMTCWLGKNRGDEPRPNDTLQEIYQRIRRDPNVDVVLVEGQCSACDACDGFHPANGRCVHAGGLIRDYKKDLDVLQKLGLQPGARLPAREYLNLLYQRIRSAMEICGYRDGQVTAEEWRICESAGDPEAYERGRERMLRGQINQGG